MPDFTVMVQTKYGIQERPVIRFEPDPEQIGHGHPVPMLLNGEMMIRTPTGGLLIVEKRIKRR